jgi:ATP adenylyltransferase
MKRFPSPRCASAIQIVRSLESKAETQPQLHPAFAEIVREARTLLIEEDASIQGFNVGVNSGSAAGQTVMHTHIHVIPRRAGDTANPHGGVRGVIPGKANYGNYY